MTTPDPIIEVTHLRKLFPVHKGFFRRGAAQFVHAVDDVSLRCSAGKCWRWWVKAAAASRRWR